MELTQQFRENVREAVLTAREKFGGSDASYANKLGISASVFSRLKKGETERIISDMQWLTFGREFNVNLNNRSWKVARTEVYNQIEENIRFCKEFSKSMILVDDCGIGKTFSARHIVSQLENGFYIDCSQAKTKSQFIRALAKTVGMDNKGRYIDVKENLKYFLSMLEKPLIVLDEAGDLDYKAFLEIKELWNATDGFAGWYMMGADGLRAKISKGLRSQKVGYAEIFSRFSDEFIKLVPNGIQDRQEYYADLIRSVASVNMEDKTLIGQMVKKCLSKESTLRYLQTLIQMNR